MNTKPLNLTDAKLAACAREFCLHEERVRWFRANVNPCTVRKIK